MATSILADASAASHDEHEQTVGQALNISGQRARAVLAIFQEGDFYDMAASYSEDAYALLTAAELLLKDVLNQAQAGTAAHEAIMHDRRGGSSAG